MKHFTFGPEWGILHRIREGGFKIGPDRKALDRVRQDWVIIVIVIVGASLTYSVAHFILGW
jgi:hypothetical protein